MTYLRVALVMLAAAFPAVAHADDTATLSTTAQRAVHLRADPQVRAWVSRADYRSPLVYYAIRVDGHSVPADGGPCDWSTVTGRGVTVRLNTCGTPWRLRARYVSWGGEHRVTLIWRPVWR